MLALSLRKFPQATVAKKPAHRGEREVSRKAIAQGMSECFRCPVCSCAPNAQFRHTRPRVQRAPGIPCALYSKRRKRIGTARAKSRRENADACGHSSIQSEASWGNRDHIRALVSRYEVTHANCISQVLAR